MAVSIDRRLNLVVPVDGDDGSVLYVHAAPIGRQVFERYFKVIARAFTEIYGGGYSIVGGPPIALLMIRDAAHALGMAEEVESGLIAEMRRLANAVVLTPNGWETLPYDEAVRRKLVSEEDAAAVESRLAFFTLVWSMHSRQDRGPVIAGASRMWDAHVTSLSSTEYAASLSTSIAVANTGETVTIS